MNDEMEWYHLSPQQRWSWQWQQPVLYPAFLSARVQGPLDTGTLQRAFRQLVERHEALRLLIGHVAGIRVPMQRLAGTPGATWQALDYSGLDGDAAALAEAELRRTAATTPFDANGSEHVRVWCVRRSDTEHLLILSLPALLADGQSLALLFRDWAALYHGKDLPPAFPYLDFAEWQNEVTANDPVEADVIARELGLETLRPQRLPFERAGDQRPAAPLGDLAFPLGEHVTRRIGTLASALATDPLSLLAAAGAIALQRVRDAPAVGFSIAMPMRTYEEFATGVGLFAKVMPLVCDPAAPRTFETLAGAIVARRERLATWQERYDPARAVAGTSPAELPYYLDYWEQEEIRQEGLSWQLLDRYSRPAPYSLALCLVRRSSGVFELQVDYDPSRLDEADVVALQRHVAGILADGVSQPARTSEALARAALNGHLADQFVRLQPDGATRPVHQRIEEHAARVPAALAIVSDDGVLTYGELNRRANALARRLRQAGVRPDTLVGLWVDRGMAFPVGALAILKAGGAFVPLDPGYPEERLALMVADARLSVIVGETRYRETLAGLGARVICVDQEPAGDEPGDEPLPLAVTPRHLAYMIYTSGSTGSPKGVLIEHGSLAHYVDALQTVLGLTPNDGYLHTASIAFSSSVRQLFLPLANGARVILTTSRERTDPRLLLERVRDSEATVMDLVPAYWRQCLHLLASLPAAEHAALSSNRVRLALSASDSLPRDIPRRWRAFGHPATFINMYGQTETTGIVATYTIPPTDDDPSASVPIGRPLPHAGFLVLDAERRPVEPWVTGELYITGPALARGYHQQPALTGATFVTLGDAPGVRAYYAGDLVRQRPDGVLEFMGRADHQIKVSGVRIDPSEIEALLRDQPTVRDAAVTRRAAGDDGESLVALVTARTAGPVDLAALRRVLAERLPPHMLPGAIEEVSALPLTPNGKVDRPALAHVATSPVVSPPLAPETEVQRELAHLWCAVLGVSHLGIHDNFFQHGGSSIAGVQLLARINNRFGLALTWPLFFTMPTIAELAAYIEAIRWSRAAAHADTGATYEEEIL